MKHKKRKKICIITNLHLCSNPRVWKEAISLANKGYSVTIITTWTSIQNKKDDLNIIKGHNINYICALNLIPEESFVLMRLYQKAKSRLALEAKKILGIDSVLLLGYDPSPTVKKALQENSDLYICHAEQSLYVGKALIEKGKKVAFDFEDWYSRDYLVTSRPVKMLKKLEDFAIHNGTYCSCPSISMAKAITLTYKAPKPIHVLYNGFSLAEAYDPSFLKDSIPFSLVWFSQTIGPGRGLETLIESLNLLNFSVQIHLIGDCSPSYEVQLKNSFPQEKGHQLFIHSRVPHHQLLSILSQYKIGLASEYNFPESRDTTITNKILQYLQAGVKVLATKTQGQQEVSQYFPKSIVLVPFDSPSIWAEKIEYLMLSEDIDQYNQYQTFVEHFSWESQEKKLLAAVNNALNEA